MSYQVLIKRKIERNLYKLPIQIQQKLAVLLCDLRDSGPIQPRWPNYSKLAKETYHCHLGNSWVACWKSKNKEVIIEIYYVGSRENAPY